MSKIKTLLIGGRKLFPVLTAFAVASVAQAAPPGPTPIVPGGGSPPGAFPNTSVSGVNVVAKGNAAAFDGRVEITGFEGNGPIPWVINRYNRGDFAMRLAPANSAGANANTLNKGFIDFLGATDAALPENQVWRPNPILGISIPTARQNGPINWGDGVGDFFPTVAMGLASSGPGYSMTDGSFGTGQLDIEGGMAGNPTATSPEANFSFSVAWFPYDAGWLGGDVGNPNPTTGGSSWNEAGGHAAGLTASMMHWSEFPSGSGTYGGLGELQLPGVDVFTNGMIFTTSSQGNSDVNIVGVAPTNDSTKSVWIVTVREDSATTGEVVASAGQYQFEFLYVPYNAQNLIGGYINGTSGAKIQSAGTYTIARTAAGTYEVTIPGKAATNGTFLLQAADFEPGTTVPMATRAFMSYQYNSGSGKFIIQSRTMTSDTASALTDVNFYLAWVDFQNPMTPPEGPRMRVKDAVAVSAEITVAAKEGNLAVNTDQPEILVTTVDEINSGGYIDPTTTNVAQQALIGYFVDPYTLTNTRGPFFIMGNSSGAITRHDVKYNPVSKQYNVVGQAILQDGVNDLLMIARVNPNSVAGGNEPLVNVFVYDGITNGLNYDDVSIAVSPVNGNFIVVAEHNFVGEGGEGTVGILFNTNGVALTTNPPSRQDLRQSAGDEDDPDVIYLPKKNAFFYLANTDAAAAAQLTNRIVGSVVQTTASGGALQISGPEQSLSLAVGPTMGHAASIENPFNGEIITAYDLGGNNVPNGELSYYSIGAGPTYTFSLARPAVPYLTGSGQIPFRHQHPQLDVDPTSGTFVLGFQARESLAGYTNAYVFRVLDSTGAIMPSQLGLPYFLADSGGPIDTGANYHNIKYDKFSDSFIAVFTANNPVSGNRITYVSAVAITSSHLASPILSIERSGSNVILRWPVSASSYTLESRTSLSSGSWSPVGGSPVVEGGFLKLTVPATGTTFYRLHLL